MGGAAGKSAVSLASGVPLSGRENGVRAACSVAGLPRGCGGVLWGVGRGDGAGREATARREGLPGWEGPDSGRLGAWPGVLRCAKEGAGERGSPAHRGGQLGSCEGPGRMLMMPPLLRQLLANRGMLFAYNTLVESTRCSLQALLGRQQANLSRLPLRLDMRLPTYPHHLLSGVSCMSGCSPFEASPFTGFGLGGTGMLGRAGSTARFAASWRRCGCQADCSCTELDPCGCLVAATSADPAPACLAGCCAGLWPRPDAAG